MNYFSICCLISFLLIYLLALFRILETILLDLSNALHLLKKKLPLKMNPGFPGQHTTTTVITATTTSSAYHRKIRCDLGYIKTIPGMLKSAELVSFQSTKKKKPSLYIINSHPFIRSLYHFYLFVCFFCVEYCILVAIFG